MPSELAIKVLEKIFKDSDTDSSSILNKQSSSNKQISNQSKESSKINRISFDNLLDDEIKQKPQFEITEKTKSSNKMSLEELSKL